MKVDARLVAPHLLLFCSARGAYRFTLESDRTGFAGADPVVDEPREWRSPLSGRSFGLLRSRGFF